MSLKLDIIIIPSMNDSQFDRTRIFWKMHFRLVFETFRESLVLLVVEQRYAGRPWLEKRPSVVKALSSRGLVATTADCVIDSLPSGPPPLGLGMTLSSGGFIDTAADGVIDSLHSAPPSLGLRMMRSLRVRRNSGRCRNLFPSCGAAPT